MHRINGMGVDPGCSQEARWVHYEKRRKVKEGKRNTMGIDRGKRNSNNFTILTKACTLVNNNKQEKGRFSTKVLYVDRIY